MERHQTQPPVNDNPIVNPLSIILVKNGSKGDRLLFRYPYEHPSTIELEKIKTPPFQVHTPSTIRTF